jgi:glycerophosphoryl diester phosphodiesterase
MKDIFDSWLINKYIAHRGLHSEDAPENSLLAFERAIKNDYAIELDIREIEDSTPVVFHDTKISRMTGKDGYTNNLKLEDLKNLKLMGTKENIPTLEEALKFINGRTPILIEIKNNFKAGTMEKQILDLLNNYKGEFAITSFNPYVMNWFKHKAPNFVRGQNSSYFKGYSISPMKKLLLKRLRLNNLSEPHFISYDARNLPNRFVKKYRHLPLLTWTVRSHEEHLRLIKHADNIIFEDFKPKI